MRCCLGVAAKAVEQHTNFVVQGGQARIVFTQGSDPKAERFVGMLQGLPVPAFGHQRTGLPEVVEYRLAGVNAFGFNGRGRHAAILPGGISTHAIGAMDRECPKYPAGDQEYTYG
jgi:hypothetical protein